MSTVLMGLGEYRFTIDTALYSELTRSREWRWPDVERVGRAPAAQYVGPGPQSIALKGTIYPHWRGGGGQIEAMCAEASKGQPLTLVAGTGKILGKWCITKVDETLTALLSNGAPRKQEFTLSLKPFGDDDQVGSAGIVSLPSAYSPNGVSAKDALDAVSSIEPELGSVGLSRTSAAETVADLSSRVGDLTSGGVTDLESIVAGDALRHVGLPVSDLTSRFATDRLGATGTLVSAFGGLSDAWRGELLPPIAGRTLTKPTDALARAVHAAEAAGKSVFS